MMSGETFAFPLSSAQRRLWFLDQMAPGNPFYNIFAAGPMLPAVNPRALERAVNEIVRRHESLRTTFDIADGNPVQIVHESVRIPLRLVELGILDSKARDVEVRRLAAEEAQAPFNLRDGPLIRTSLLKAGDDPAVFMTTMHHIVSDGWSMSIFWRELSALYSAFASWRSASLPELSIQYPDYAVWQQDWLQSSTFASQMEYWRQQLANLPVLQIPTDRPRPPVLTYRGAQQRAVISKEEYFGIHTLCQANGATLFMGLLAVFVILLAKYTGQTNITVGSPVANRGRAEFEQLIGFFVNSIVLRVSLSDNPTFLDLLARVRVTALEAFSNQDVPFDKLVEELQPHRDLSRNPLFQITLQVVNTPDTKAAGAFSDAEKQWDVHRGSAIFDLALSFVEGKNNLLAVLEYSTELFDRSTIERLIAHFRNVLAAVIRNPHVRVSDVSPLSEDERRALTGVKGTGDGVRKDPRCVHELFEFQVAKGRSRPAVLFGEQTLTYGELDDRANQFARYLKALNTKPDSVVAVCLERSFDLVVAFLGTLKAGAAYLPLDPRYPQERLDVMLSTSQPDVIITTEQYAQQVGRPSVATIILEKVRESIERESAAPPSTKVRLDNLAYVLYTSGSTGTPKGVMIPHRALTNHMLWMQDRFPLDENDAVLQRTPASFDASVWEFYAPLIAGAKLVLARPGEHGDITRLAQTVVEHSVTALQMVPSLLRLLLEEPAFRKCRSLKRVFSGGEALTSDILDRFFAIFDIELCNLYGPTEVCIDSVFNTCTSSHRTTAIGTPVSNIQPLVLDVNLQPVPIGILGELYLAGDGLARGYQARPDLTAECFLPNPFSDIPGVRMYRTGDLVRWNQNGELEYVGRTDRQVKIRGYRIEPSEVEHSLNRCHGVSKAVVIAKDYGQADKRLIAYYVPKELHTTIDLRRFLQPLVPEHMIPSAFVPIERIPLTPNGKIDWSALPDPNQTPGPEMPFISPANALEEVIADVWAEVFQLQRVSTRANFFSDLGGHSLLATHAISKLRSTLEMEIPLQRIFEYPTVEELANTIAGDSRFGAKAKRIAELLVQLSGVSDDAVAELVRDRSKAQQGVNL